MPVANDYDLSRLCTYGRKFVVEPVGTRLSIEERHQFERLQPAGIMLRSRNFLQQASYAAWFDEFHVLLDDIRAAANRTDLIICIDHEGGRIIRPPSPITRFPYAARWNAHTPAVAEAMALELKSLGINLSFAPVADIHSNPSNPVINQRAFGQTASTVSELAREFYSTLKSNGINGCAKHFPGHGDTSVDSHFELPVLNVSATELKDRELKPFQHLINSGLSMVMTGHLMLPCIDTRWPATLSHNVIQTMLRDQMGFSGVVISDGLGMDAIRTTLESPGAVIQGVNAGLDLFLVAGDSVNITDAIRWAEAMRKGVEGGMISSDTLHDSITRIDTFTEGLPQHTPHLLSETTFQKHNELAQRLADSEDKGTGPELHGFA